MVYKSKHLRDAFRNGWAVAKHGSPQHPRPQFYDQAQREAYDAGWEECRERGALGYEV